MTDAATLTRPSRSESLKMAWWSNPKTDLLSGLVVALALIPEAISFSIIAGVDPKVGLYASFSIAIIISMAGGRMGMISAATGAMALVIVDLVEEYGVGYLFAATILAGLLQIGFGYLGVGALMRFVPRTVMLGFVNALAILIFLAQVPHILLSDETSAVRDSQLMLNLLFIAIGLAVIYGLPRITKAIPSPLVAIAAIAAYAIAFDLQLPTVGDMGELPDTLPFLALPDVPFTFEMLGIILPYSLTLAFVGLLESLLTAQLLDDLTDTDSDKNRESRGQGIANVATGFLGGMAGCAMIGQSMINHRSGGRTRLSTLASGVFLLILILTLGDLVAQIPMAALVAVMIMVSVGTFSWSSIKPSTLKLMPKTETAVMITTVAIVVVTHNLAYGVAAGVLLSAVFFVRHVSHLVNVTSVVDPDNHARLYAVTGQLFFASTNDLVHAFDYDAVKVPRVEIDCTDARIWDTSAIVALDTVVAKFAERGIEAELIGLNRHAEKLHSDTSGRVGAGH
ncbi:SulP family inorganic anion transporter [Ilumatobacter coccineus]|uniref:Putative sulfate transporter n=1 Tax=Ilumatobacter coccineus (strain NBRC 103263 / KCTC 29153 / YM16-304) TaxID=1313172 RepID=A0A6C7E4J5_ILUCY|nr:SulP family inorganic anion transporter [Ilumatobacter coccineus]BAN01540.1 putative sulfate transporter [Ilumatobacter coccineus YM16-304]